MPLEFRLLGPIEVARENRRLPLESPKQRALLALFLVQPRRALSADRILSEIWPDAPPTSGVKTLRYHVSKLRNVLHQDADVVLVTVQQGYVLQIDSAQIDAVRFERLLEILRLPNLFASERPDVNWPQRHRSESSREGAKASA